MNKRLKILIIGASLVVLLGGFQVKNGWMYASGGNVSNVSVEIGTPVSYTELQVQEAVGQVKTIFAQDFPGCRLTAIRYDQERTDTFTEELSRKGTVYGWSPREALKNSLGEDPGEILEVIIFSLDFDTGINGYRLGFNSCDDYTEFQCMLVRGEHTDGWVSCDGGWGQG